jgi:murein DD-endopeptidase MepM/ murein hydrolase activator NlpD
VGNEALDIYVYLLYNIEAMKSLIAFAIITLLTLTAIAAGAFHFYQTEPAVAAIGPNLLPLSEDAYPSLIEPVDQFVAHATHKPFGIYITPETSPIKNDYHTGYHTGVDAEFTDTIGDVPVYAIADGTVIVRNWVKGYGGVIVIRHLIHGTPLYALYGHLDPNSFLSSDITQVTGGQQIAILGDDHSHETDGVRKHLHFSISSTEKLNLRGYVQTEQELTHWLNPLDFYQK